MSIDITYHCSGCFDTAEVTVRQTTRTVRPGRTLDLVEIRTPTLAGSAPEGWVAFDPYTGTTYCPACWDGIEAP